MKNINRKLDELEDKVEAKVPSEAEDDEGPMAEMLENDKDLRQAFREVRKARQRDQEPEGKYVEKIREAQKEAEYIKMLDEDPGLRDAYKELYRAEGDTEKVPPEAVETLRKAEQKAKELAEEVKK